MIGKGTFFVLVMMMALLTLCVMKYAYDPRPHAPKPRHAVELNDGYSEKITPVENVNHRNIFYNRIEKCGSRSLINITQRLQRKNNFTVVSELQYKTRLRGLELLNEKIRVASFVPRTLYQRHVHFVDFAEVPLRRPILINIIRDPISRFVSLYNYENYGDNGQKIKPPMWGRRDINACVEAAIGKCNKRNPSLFSIGMYFCGMDEMCKDSSASKQRVSLAKRHIDEYAFIGAQEEFETSIAILEKMMPAYFNGALREFKADNSTKYQTATKKTVELKEENRKKLRSMMDDEYEVYFYALRKFERLKQYYMTP